MAPAGNTMSTDPNQAAKENAAKAGADLVNSGMVIGLGSGSTAEILVAELGRRVSATGLRIQAVSTSNRTEMLAREAGIEIIEPQTVDSLDLVIDGADEVDPSFHMIKGRGGALLREKIVAAAARQRVILVDPSKPVEKLGTKHRLPVEISSFGYHWTMSRLAPFCKKHQLRLNSNGTPYITDGGNWIIDLETGPIDDVEALQARLLAIPGVFETGIFLHLCDILIIGSKNDVTVKYKTN
jgi:ribose 5-phosphate isomerase A